VDFSKCSQLEAVRLLEAHGKVAEGQAWYLIKLVETCCCLIMCCLQKPLLVFSFRSECGFLHLHKQATLDECKWRLLNKTVFTCRHEMHCHASCYELLGVVLIHESCVIAQASECESQVNLLQVRLALPVLCRGRPLGKCLGCTQAQLTLRESASSVIGGFPS